MIMCGQQTHTHTFFLCVSSPPAAAASTSSCGLLPKRAHPAPFLLFCCLRFAGEGSGHIVVAMALRSRFSCPFMSSLLPQLLLLVLLLLILVTSPPVSAESYHHDADSDSEAESDPDPAAAFQGSGLHEEGSIISISFYGAGLHRFLSRMSNSLSLTRATNRRAGAPAAGLPIYAPHAPLDRGECSARQQYPHSFPMFPRPQVARFVYTHPAFSSTAHTPLQHAFHLFENVVARVKTTQRYPLLFVQSPLASHAPPQPPCPPARRRRQPRPRPL